jgi:choline monooxygenase
MQQMNHDWLGSFKQTGTVRQGLPAQAYTSDEFWRHECEHLFPEAWAFVGFVHELAKAGDVIPVNIAGRPLLIVRNRNGDIKTFHNVCRHRCLKLVDAPGNVGKLIRCPYHAWAYDLDGELRATPHFGGREEHIPEGFDASSHGLAPVRTAIWHDWIFVNLNGEAPPFEEYVSPLATRFDGVDFTKVEPVATIDFGEIETNWKLLMENFMEPYHVQFVHPTTTDQPLVEHYTVVDGVCLGSAIDVSAETAAAAGDGTLAVSSRYLTLFPNFIIGRYFPDQIGVYLDLPAGPGRTYQKRVIYTTEGQALDAEEIAALKTLWYDVHKEDHEMCERLQKGRQSETPFGGGVLSPHWEDSVRQFQELVVAGARLDWE